MEQLNTPIMELHKLAYYNYFEPWDWYIVTTANYDDLNSSSIINFIYNTI